MNIQELKNLRVGDKVKCINSEDEDNGKVGTVHAIMCGETLDESEVHIDDCYSIFPQDYEILKFSYKTAKEITGEPDDDKNPTCFIYDLEGECIADALTEDSAKLIVAALNNYKD